MGTKKKGKRSKKEEEQANKVIKIIFAGLIILGLLLMIGVSLLG